MTKNKLHLLLLLVTILFCATILSGCCGNGQQLCGTTCYFPDRQCCNSGIVFNNLGDCKGNCYRLTNESCCNGVIYDRLNDSCCNGYVLSGKNWSSCNGACYQNQVCCNNTLCPEGYRCCNVSTANGSNPRCYDPKTWQCQVIYR